MSYNNNYNNQICMVPLGGEFRGCGYCCFCSCYLSVCLSFCLFIYMYKINVL